jgi:hypothetical protein
MTFLPDYRPVHMINSYGAFTTQALKRTELLKLNLKLNRINQNFTYVADYVSCSAYC